MPGIRDALLFAHGSGLLAVDDCMLLCDLYKPKNPDMYNENYEKFSINEDIYQLLDALQLPPELMCYNGIKLDSFEALSIFLMRFAYPCRFADLVPAFGRPIPHLCMITNEVMNILYQRWGHLLSNLNRPWLSPNNLQQYADTLREKGAALANCWAFIDEAVRPVSRAGRNQRVLYNGHKKVHAIKFQSISAPNGLIAI